MNLIALKRIKHNGKRFERNQILIEVDDSSSKRLLNLNAAKVTNETITSFPSKETTESEHGESSMPITGLDDGLGSPEDALTDDQVFNLINDHFKLDILRGEAKSLELEFAGNISKQNLINLIIEKELEEHFLDQIPE
ncbi:hypothetical protein [Psychrobacillus sp.]|uniref:hypothetical protein n=1 Tax=Psychrobacillus sp. TaxID=1871623 RepID=UPI0028BF35C3|nr:hypothetical protein [Psychrobacillus sp.]